ncbi:unnamed protein product [Clonostachys rosea]|uniref:AB hydrolase-1 domain-containing protein n=1 Tax=Bionectria ochroleuca TaxID=29856 RepID=A0ABY6TSG5_BIOOC|nr:unnamed protein product [Clonostachys rosea]
MPRTIFLVPGLWEGPGSYEPLVSSLKKIGFNTFVSSLKSTGTRSPANPTLKDDIAGIHEDLEKVVDEAGAEGVILFLHSAGGFIGSNAMEGLAASTRKSAGKAGGVVKIIFFSAGLAPEGSDTFGGPFILNQDDGSCVCVDSVDSLFHDLPAAEAAAWQAKMDVQPLIETWKGTITYCGWKDVSSTYIICEEDRLLPIPVQEAMAAMAGSKVVRLACGHMGHISATDDLAEVIKRETDS